MNPWLSIVGLGEDGLDGLAPAARLLVDDAEIIVGGDRHFELLGETKAETHAWESPLKKTVERLEGFEGRKVCVLATGDPMAYGIGVTLMRRFGRKAVVILPGISAFTLACARLGWPLAETVQLTLHGRPLELINAYLVPGQRLLILSEDRMTPAVVAQRLNDAGFGPSEIHVLCHMGGPKERIVSTTAAKGVTDDVDDLNTLAIDLAADPDAVVLPRTPGLPDDAFRHDGQLTKQDIRAMAVSALQSLPGRCLWDVGAGCGSVAIEWMRAADRTTAIAIERNEERRAMIAENASALGTPGLRIVAGEAPDAFEGLAAPDAVFVGGGVGMPGLIQACWDALKPGGRLVANSVTLNGERTLTGLYARHGGELVRVSVACAGPVGRLVGWRPLMPVTQWRVTKP
ncbi:MAG: precorrin-6y C5,15-methyltransferase (decarboxylating) subunit CbiE [Rhodospirillales bacterium]|nr:precorrin-6y C5,15-methyltransferase (decarboxylating) subunit CbiE [Rhodospirillales bacterium]